jgi:hypothetical protein
VLALVVLLLLLSPLCFSFWCCVVVVVVVSGGGGMHVCDGRAPRSGNLKPQSVLMVNAFLNAHGSEKGE